MSQNKTYLFYIINNFELAMAKTLFKTLSKQLCNTHLFYVTVNPECGTEDKDYDKFYFTMSEDYPIPDQVIFDFFSFNLGVSNKKLSYIKAFRDMNDEPMVLEADLESHLETYFKRTYRNSNNWLDE